jgi:hypothetical protein
VLWYYYHYRVRNRGKITTCIATVINLAFWSQLSSERTKQNALTAPFAGAARSSLLRGLGDNLCLHICYPRLGTAWATGGVYVIYIWPLPEIRAVSINQFYVSFGLDDRYLILIVTKCYRDISEPVTLTVSLTRKPNVDRLGHARTIAGGL